MNPKVPATTARLRHEIDSGRTGDKVGNMDPAAAPLGTDDEAAGTPPSREAIRTAISHEVKTAKGSTGQTDWSALALFTGSVFFLALLMVVVRWALEAWLV